MRVIPIFTSTAPYSSYKKNPDISLEPPSWISPIVILILGISFLFDSYVTFLLSWVIFLDHQKVEVLYIFTSNSLGVCVIYTFFCRFLSSLLPLFLLFFPLLFHILCHFSLFVPLIYLLLKRQTIYILLFALYFKL